MTGLIAHTETDQTAALVHVGVYDVNVFSITWVQPEARVSIAVKIRTSWVQSLRGKNGKICTAGSYSSFFLRIELILQLAL